MHAELANSFLALKAPAVNLLCTGTGLAYQLLGRVSSVLPATSLDNQPVLSGSPDFLQKLSDTH